MKITLRQFIPVDKDYAAPGNKQCGVCPPDVPENLAKNY
jgi:hypothetical protein